MMVAPGTKVDVTSTQLNVIRDFDKIGAGSASEVAGKVVSAYEVLQLVRSGRPAETDTTRKVYDAAVLTLGNNNAGKAEEALMGGIMKAISGPLAGVKNKADLGDNAARTATVADSVNTELNNPNYMETYARLGYYGSNAASTLAANARTARTFKDEYQAHATYGLTNARTTGTVDLTPGLGTSDQTRITYQNDFDFGPLFYAQFKDNREVFAVGGTPSDEQLALFGGNDASASAFIASVANGIALSYGDHDISSAFLTGLATNLNAVTNTQVRANEHFREALELIQLAGTKNDMKERRGLLTQAMMELKNQDIGTLFNGLYRVANNQLVVAMDQRAVTVYSSKGTVMIDLFGTMDDFRGHLKTGNRAESYGRAVVSLALSVAADYLITGAEAYATTQNIGGELQQVGGKTSVAGRGYAINATPQLWFSSSMSKRPTQVILYANFGYLDITMDKTVRTVTPEGATIEEVVRKGDPYLGVYGIEMRFPSGIKHESWRIERAGAGAFSGREKGWKNAFALVTFSYAPKRFDTDQTRVMIQATPAYRGIVNLFGEYQAIPSLEMRGTWLRRMNAHIVSLDPTATVQHNAKTGVWTLDGGAGIAWKPTSSWEFSVKGGAIGDMGGTKTKQVPWTGYVSGGVKYYIGAPKASKSTVQESVPTRLTAPPAWNETVKAEYDSAVALLGSTAKADKDAVTGDKGWKLARELAGDLEGQVSLHEAPFKTIGDMPAYRRAIGLLRLGKLREGVAALRTAGLFE